MPETRITIDDRAVTLEIEDPHGELIPYVPRLVEGGLELHNRHNDERYTLMPQSPQLWKCDCPAWKFRKSAHAPRGCKHAAALMHLYKFLVDFSPLVPPFLEREFMSDATPEIRELVERLAEPFDPRAIKFRAGAVSGGRALALAYVDARVIQDRLDEVLGVAGWQDSYECLPDGSVTCRLRLRLGVEWIEKMDVGGPSEQPDEGDRRKAAFSDSLKRAAVKFGVGRYIYRIPSQWVEYDPQRKQLKGTPTLPPFALPGRKAQTGSPRPAATVPQRGPDDPPTDGIEMEQRLGVHERRAVKGGFCREGELFQHVIAWAVKMAGVSAKMDEWPALVVTEAWAEFLRWRDERKAQKKTA